MLTTHAGHDTPIHAGEAVPIAGDQAQPHVDSAASLTRWPHEPPLSDNGATFLVDTIHQHQGEITLLCLASLTTVARAIQIDPTIMDDVSELIIMGGHFWSRPDGPEAEWNFFVDPEAAEIVYNRCRSSRTISLDVTHDVSLTRAELSSLAARSQLLAPVMDMAEAHFAKYDQVFLHDPLAAATIFDEDFCSYDQGEIRIDANPGRRGMSLLVPSEETAHQVSRTVDSRRFVAHAAEVLSGALQHR